MKHLQCVLLVVLGMSFPSKAWVQPTDYEWCYGDPRIFACVDVLFGVLIVHPMFCPVNPGIWEGFRGRLAFGPFLYAGPVTIEVDALRSPETDQPIYVEYVPVKTHPAGVGFCDGPALVFMKVFGQYPCLPVDNEKRGPLPLNGLLPGDLYYIRLHFLGGEGTTQGSPYFRCIRIYSSGLSAVVSSTWTATKQLYR